MRIDPGSLMGLEAYDRARKEFRARLIPHRRRRSVQIGPHVRLLFEDELTIRYQIQEMLRAERIFEEEGILQEIEVYGPLIPDGSNWKATMLIEYESETERRHELARLIDIEDRVWVRVAGFGKVAAVADEDMERETPDKTASVHFLRFELAADQVAALKAGAALEMGVDHPRYEARVQVSEETRQALLRDLQ